MLPAPRLFSLLSFPCLLIGTTCLSMLPAGPAAHAAGVTPTTGTTTTDSTAKDARSTFTGGEQSPPAP
ncbi:hypothetical protein, partial [Novacetimonas maltaceti]